MTQRAARGNDNVGCVADRHDLRRLHRLRIDPDEAVRHHDGRRRLLSSGQDEPNRGGSDDEERGGGKTQTSAMSWSDAGIDRRRTRRSKPG